MEWNNLSTYLENYGKNITDKYKQLSGNNKVTYEVDRFGDTYILELDLGKYWKWIEDGRKPGKMPPVSSILKWAKKKGLHSNTKKLESIAFAIAKNISKKGLKGKKYLESSKNTVPNFKTGLDKQIKKDLEQFNKENLKWQT